MVPDSGRVKSARAESMGNEGVHQQRVVPDSGRVKSARAESMGIEGVHQQRAVSDLVGSKVQN